MTRAVLDDHLLRDLVGDEVSSDLAGILRRRTPATTNLYVLRLCKSVVAARGGALTGSWPAERRQALGRSLVEQLLELEIVPLSTLAFRVVELTARFRLSNLGAEAVAAAEHLNAPLCVWEGDDGPRIRAAAKALGVRYRMVKR